MIFFQLLNFQLLMLNTQAQRMSGQALPGTSTEEPCVHRPVLLTFK